MAEASSLPPSAKYVLDVVEQEVVVTRQELLARTDLVERTLDRALDRLQNDGHVIKTRKNEDLRQTTVKLASE